MKALGFTRFGRADQVIEVLDVPEAASPGPGEVQIELIAAPINPADLLKAEGRYGAATMKLPAFCGTEGLGEVTLRGDGVDHLQDGDRVLLRLTGVPAWRERMTVPAARLFALPEGDPLQLAMVAANPATAHLLLTSFRTLSEGEWIIQNAANSAVGQNVVRLAKISGIRTINVVRDNSSVAALDALGADVVIVDGPDLADRVLRRTSGERPKLGLDAVAGEATRRLAGSLAPGGTIAVYGLLSGEPCRIDAADLVFRDLTVRGFWLAPWLEGASSATLHSMYGEFARLTREGKLGVRVEATYGLDRCSEALAHAAQERRSGKILFVGDRRGSPHGHRDARPRRMTDSEFQEA